MRVERKEINSTTVLSPLGDLTIETAPHFFTMNDAVGDQRCAIVVDLSKVGAIDIARHVMLGDGPAERARLRRGVFACRKANASATSSR